MSLFCASNIQIKIHCYMNDYYRINGENRLYFQNTSDASKTRYNHHLPNNSEIISRKPY